MSTEIKVPTLGESVTTATIARWMKQPGEAVAADEPLVELETDKVTVEVTAPSAGVLTSIAAAEGSEVEVGALLGMIEAGVTPSVAGPAANPTAGVRPPPRPLGPVARPATAPAPEPPPGEHLRAGHRGRRPVLHQTDTPCRAPSEAFVFAAPRHGRRLSTARCRAALGLAPACLQSPHAAPR